MALKAPQGAPKGDFVKQANIEPDVYPGRLVQIIDLGLQAQKPYQGQEKKPVNELMLTYELVDVFMVDKDGKEVEDKPRWISETLPFYGLYADKAKSTKRYLAFDPQNVYGGDFAQCVNTPVNVTVVTGGSGDKLYDNVGNVSPMNAKKAAACPELKNPPKVFDLDSPDMETFNKLPQWIQDKIKSNLNFQGSKLQKLVGGAKQEAPKKEEAPWEEAQTQDNNNPY